ncbi:MAG: OmpA/MotB domain-containing protein [Bacteroidetes bacterium OLB12]|nr:MAG: OmpA/MotB domain-containing protein [Bacteroidetes bacterium OLB12]
MAIPFGVGMKYVLNPKYYLAVEFGMRKTFFDYLDNISDGDLQYKNYQYGNVFDYDNYFLWGFRLPILCTISPAPAAPTSKNSSYFNNFISLTGILKHMASWNRRSLEKRLFLPPCGFIKGKYRL